MPNKAIAALTEILRPEIGLSKSRLETLCLIVIGMVSARSVNLSHLACERPGPVRTTSTYRRLQRFFEHVRLDEDWALPLLVRLLGLNKSWLLAQGRTNLQIGKTEVNFLVLVVVTHRFRAPLVWSVIEGRGCSDTGMRIALMGRYLAHFPAATIRFLLADDAIADRGAHAVIPPRRNARPWKPTTAGAVTRNEALRASKYLGRAIWRNWSGYHRRSRAETKMNCMKLLGQRLMARDFDRQVAEVQIRIAIMNGYTALGIPVTKAVG